MAAAIGVRSIGWCAVTLPSPKGGPKAPSPVGSDQVVFSLSADFSEIGAGRINVFTGHLALDQIHGQRAVLGQQLACTGCAETLQQRLDELGALGAGFDQQRDRISVALDDLQDVVQEIRTTIFDLHGGQVTRLRQRLEQAVNQMTDHSPVRATLHVTGPLSVVDAALADHAAAVVREAVSNVVRHAGARSVTVS